MPNFIKALEKAGRDFRSDTITVPNQEVMQVGFFAVTFCHPVRLIVLTSEIIGYLGSISW